MVVPVVLICSLAIGAGQAQSLGRGVSVIVVGTQQEAEELRTRIDQGDSFEALAMTHSKDASASSGGYIGAMDPINLDVEFRSVLQELSPGAVSSVVRYGAGFVLLRRGTADEDAWRLQNNKGTNALQQGHYKEAGSLFLAAVQQAERLRPSNFPLAESLVGLARASLYQQTYTDAERHARRSLAILEKQIGSAHEAVISGLSVLATAVQSRGGYSEAEQIYRRILSIRWSEYSESAKVGSSEVLENLAETIALSYTGDARLNEALENYRQSVAAAKLKKSLYLAMRDGLFTANLVEESETLMEQAVRSYPDSRQLRFQLAELYVKTRKYREALKVFEDALQRGAHPDPSVDRGQRVLIYEKIAEVNELMDRFDDAFDAIRKAIKISPESAGPRVALGDLYLSRTMMEESAAEYERANDNNPAIAAAHYGLAQASLNLGRVAESVEEARRALALDPAHQKARYVLAMALVRSGQEREGRAILEEYRQKEAEERTLESAKKDVAATGRAVSELVAEGKLQEAGQLLLETIPSHPEASVLYLRLGLIQGRMGLHREAIQTFETMVNLGLDDFMVHRSLSREYVLAGDLAAGQAQRALYLQKYDAALVLKAAS